MSDLICGIHHVALKCAGKEQYAETLRFYKEILGMTLVRGWKGGCMLSMGADGGILEIFEEGAVSGSTGSVNHFALLTKDTDACLEAVRAAGYPVTMEATNIVIPVGKPYPLRIGFCIGPVGEEIEFFCEREL